MTHHNLYLTLCEVTFGVYDQDKCTGSICLTPLGCELEEQGDNPDAPRYCVYGLYYRMKIEVVDGFLAWAADFISPTCFRDLLTMLTTRPPTEARKATISGQDANIEIDFTLLEDGAVRVTGHTPASGNVPHYHFTMNPDLLRKQMSLAVRFEFEMAPEAIADSCGEIERLLDHIQSLEVAHSR